MNKDLSVYIHIPFCLSKCYYCDFVSYTGISNDLIEQYIEAVCIEILNNADILSGYNIKSIYFGGGTPSSIESKYIEKIMNTLNLFYSNEIENDNYKNREVTIEVNPGSVTKESLQSYINCGINRLSIGLQSTDNITLKKIGRIHTYEDFLQFLNYCKCIGISNISVDLMYPLPTQTLSKFETTLDNILELDNEFNINHISIYNLEIHENTKLEFLLKENYEKLVDEDEEMQMKRLLEEKLANAGYINYEISNFSRPGYESIHNLNYWNQGYYLGFGVNASSFFAGTRYTNKEDLHEYISSISKNISPVRTSIYLDKLELMKEYIILKLRLKEGFNCNDFKHKFDINVEELFNVEINKLIKLNLLIKSNDNIFLSEKGRDLANIVWEEFV